MGLDVAYPPPSIALTNPSHRHATLETILPLPNGDEASSSNGLTRASHLRSRATNIRLRGKCADRCLWRVSCPVRRALATTGKLAQVHDARRSVHAQ